MCTIDSVCTSAPTGQGCESKSVKMTADIQIVPHRLKNWSNMENIQLAPPLVTDVKDYMVKIEVCATLCGSLRQGTKFWMLLHIRVTMLIRTVIRKLNLHFY